ncbi:ferritin-like domain-containing protein [Algoriphagus sp.]|uniref:ferritin-like domain-containing protein n=1 Tax=Algoriphagus sp. TaxID=1872435 RepID=UPI0025EFC78A|nr:ferritin-like domain-containing protein [Algoriphagus sp.]
MSQKNLQKIQPDAELHQMLQSISETEKEEFIELIYSLLKQASTTEHLLAMQYLFTSFSLKKYPEEFSDYKPDSEDPDQKKINELRVSQIEKIRRWEANILMVSREEMTHLCYDMNLLAILGKDPYMYRPNFPVPATSFPLGKPVNLMPLSLVALEIFRYWEKPDHLPVSDPIQADGIPKGLEDLFTIPHKGPDQFNHPETHQEAMDFLKKFLSKSLDQDILKKIHDPLSSGTHFDSIEQLYTFIRAYLLIGLKYKIFEGQNMERIVDEHYGFNIALNPLVLGQFEAYVEEAITQIIEEGEGVWGTPPALGSHFWVFQTIIKELKEEFKESILPFEPALPVVWNPTYITSKDRHLINLIPNMPSNATFQVTNTVAIKAMQLFNEAYTTMIKMLSGFFGHYEIDQTTGIRPPQVNAYFQTAFYPFMTNIIRPLGEMICRLPADEGFVPDGRKVPDRCAGPDFLFDIIQTDPATREEVILPYDCWEKYVGKFNDMKDKAFELKKDCEERGYHMAFYLQPDARDFPVSFGYLGENFERIGKNFEAYWKGKMVAPISSKGFQNYSTNFN